MKKPLRVLVVEDSEYDARIMLHQLKNGGYDLAYERVETAEAMHSALREKTWDVILCDYRLPQFNGMEAIELLKETGIDIPIIIVSGAIGEETAVATMKAGAHDYIMKDNLARLVPAIDRELKECIVRREHSLVSDVLQESEERFRRISSMITDIAYSCSVKEDGRFSIDWMTGATERICGYSIEEIKLQECWRFLVVEEDLAAFEKNITGLAPGSHGSCELRIRHKKGNIVWIASYAECIMYSEMPERFHLYGALVDISERKQAEEALTESETRYKSMFENNHAVILLIDPDNGHITDANSTACAYYGWSREEFKKKKIDEINTLDREAVFAEMQLAQTEQRKYFFFKHRRADGTISDVEVYSGPILIKGKTLLYSIVHDITNRKKAEVALQESEKRFMDVLRSSNDATLLIDGDKFADCNEATARMLKYSTREDFLKSHPSELSPPTQPDGRSSFEKANEMMSVAFERGFHQFEWEHRRANGEVFPVEVSLTSIVLHGKNVLHCVWHDITERKQAEEELQRTLERLKRAINATIQVMVSAIEVRDPYTSGHQVRVANIARVMATEMELPAEIVDGIRMAATIHDIGKLSIPAEILSKPTKLTAIEYSLIKEHSRSGYEILKGVESPWPLAEIVYQHHERMDGSGYPRNLKGDDILMEARIMAVADVVESMASHRPYRPALGLNAAMAEIENNKGTLYDSDVVDACLRLFREKDFHLEVA